MVEAGGDTKEVREGKVVIRFPGESATVFYNPAQEFNRDLTVAVLRAFVAERRENLKEDPAPTAEPGAKRRKVDLNEPKDGSIRVLDALSASGLRALRFAKEVDGVAHVVANDFSDNAVIAIQENVAANGLSDKIEPRFGDATTTMMEHRPIDKRFHAVDLDPYGSATQFLDSAVQCVADKGILMITCTDMAVLCGNSPDACFNKYGAIPLRVRSCHEQALRILLRCVDTTANRYTRYIEPLVSISVDFYVRIFVRMHSGAKAAKDSACRTGYLLSCTGCKTFEIEPIVRRVEDGDSLKFTPAILGANMLGKNSRCRHCGSAVHRGGPLWTGRLHNLDFIDRMLKQLKATPENERLGTHKRLTGVLTMAKDELPDVPLFWEVNCLVSITKTSVPKFPVVRSALLNAGYKVSVSHCSPNALKTNAPADHVWDICRQLSAQQRLNIERLPPDSPGRRILEAPITHAVDFRLHKDAEPCVKNMIRFPDNRGKNHGPRAKAKGSVNSAQAGFQISTTVGRSAREDDAEQKQQQQDQA